jgi:group II intron reverse transcriptase/maturase
MEGRKQNISQDSSRQNDRTASDSYDGAQTYIGITDNCLTEVQFSKEKLLEQILSPDNLNLAYKQVVSNKGSSGIDRMPTTELLSWLLAHKDELLASIYAGTYRPNPVRRVEIPKDNGKTRPLGIPTVIDRFIQQAISQVLTKMYDPVFSPSSYGFRPGRNAHQALEKALSIINDGYCYAVDIDLEKFFDTVNQSKLIEMLSRRIKDGRVISLIHKYLRSGVMVDAHVEVSDAGVPQGSPLSPLLGNIMLDELDRELERRGHPFVRYADDGLIFCRSERAAERTKTSITRFIESRLYLRVNQEKTHSGSVMNMKFLGYSFYNYKGGYRLYVHPKSVDKLKARLKSITSRHNGWSFENRKTALKYFIRGWVVYFKLADMQTLIQKTDSWLRRRIRMCIWKSWKLFKTRLRNLIRCGIDTPTARGCAYSRRGYWYTANCPTVQHAISNDKLRKAGYVTMIDVYENIASQIKNRRIPNGTYGGVRGRKGN